MDHRQHQPQTSVDHGTAPVKSLKSPLLIAITIFSEGLLELAVRDALLAAMAGNRKNRQSSNAASDASSRLLTTATSKSAHPSGSSKELLEAVEEVDRFFFRISISEMIILLVFLLSFVLSTFLAAMAAEISISVQYFDRPAPPVFSELDKREQELNNHRFRVTAADQDMASVNAAMPRDMHHQKFRLQRVIHFEPSGHPKAMLVVEESKVELARSSSSPRLRYDGGAGSSSGSSKAKTPVSDMTKLSVLPKLCADGVTSGFDSWERLKAAMLEANKLSVENFVRWSRFFADNDFSGTFEDDNLYYEDELVFRICPGTVLRAKQGPIFINAPNFVLECEGCVVSVGASHLSFGPNAKNVVIRGFTFTNARSSSLVFFHNGAEVAFEDCFWYGNTAISSRFGAVADINSTSIVNFYRCNIGQGRPEENDLASSLSIRI